MNFTQKMFYLHLHVIPTALIYCIHVYFIYSDYILHGISNFTFKDQNLAENLHLHGISIALIYFIHVYFIYADYILHGISNFTFEDPNLAENLTNLADTPKKLGIPLRLTEFLRNQTQ